MSLSGSPADFVLAFFGGVLISLTPCVYPLLPISIAYIGASSAGSKARGFGLSLIYVTGISITYAILGLVAALSGSIFGRFSILPPVRIFAGLVIIFFGFSLWTVRGLRLPGLKMPVKKSTTYLSCFILGLTSGLVISPCTAPALGSILIFVATKRNLIYGAFLLLSFAYGMGLLLIIAGTFSSILTTLPKSGKWMELVKKICAAILICVGIFFVVSGTINLAYAKTLEAADTRFDFQLQGLDGNKITLSEFKNKQSVVLFFWTTWCHYCRAELKNLNQMHSALREDAIEVLAINIEESELKIRSYLGSNPVAFKILLDTDGYVAGRYRILGIPTFVLVNKTGEIVFQDYYFPTETYNRLLSQR